METSEKQSLREHLSDSGLPDAQVESLLDSIWGLIQMLVDSDAIGKASILRAQKKPHNPLPKGGQAQLCLVLYWLKYPPPILTEIIDSLPDNAQNLWKKLDKFFTSIFPPTITPAEYDWAVKQMEGVLAPDGTILGTSTYEDFDEKWLWAFFNYLINVADPGRIAPFTPAAGGKPHIGEIKMSNGECRIALVGDWGTGKYNAGGYDPATDVLAAIGSMKPPPDYIIHLGDVYYAGTDIAPPPNEESQNFVSLWPKYIKAGRSFTLNSNHEMYGGANGYFDVALGRKASSPTPFAHQNGYSYFALTAGKTVIVGLDAAYFDPSSLYMEGGLGARSKNPQYAFLQQIADSHEDIILLTHQTAMSMDGTATLPLWNDVTQVVPASKIKLWYWGHVHMGVAYGPDSALGKHGVRCGCSGHGAIPMGVPWGLQQQGQGIDWYSHTPVGNGAYPNRVKNGFSMLTLSANGCTEAFYEPGNPNPVWTRS